MQAYVFTFSLIFFGKRQILRETMFILMSLPNEFQKISYATDSSNIQIIAVCKML